MCENEKIYGINTWCSFCCHSRGLSLQFHAWWIWMTKVRHIFCSTFFRTFFKLCQIANPHTIVLLVYFYSIWSTPPTQNFCFFPSNYRWLPFNVFFALISATYWRHVKRISPSISQFSSRNSFSSVYWIFASCIIC